MANCYLNNLFNIYWQFKINTFCDFLVMKLHTMYKQQQINVPIFA